MQPGLEVVRPYTFPMDRKNMFFVPYEIVDSQQISTDPVDGSSSITLLYNKIGLLGGGGSGDRTSRTYKVYDLQSSNVFAIVNDTNLSSVDKIQVETAANWLGPLKYDPVKRRTHFALTYSYLKKLSPEAEQETLILYEDFLSQYCAANVDRHVDLLAGKEIIAGRHGKEEVETLRKVLESKLPKDAGPIWKEVGAMNERLNKFMEESRAANLHAEKKMHAQARTIELLNMRVRVAEGDEVKDRARGIRESASIHSADSSDQEGQNTADIKRLFKMFEASERKQDEEMTAMKIKAMEQDDEMTAMKTKAKEQDEEMTAMKTKADEQLERIDQLETDLLAANAKNDVMVERIRTTEAALTGVRLHIPPLSCSFLH